jgi:hypothetical protein
MTPLKNLDNANKVPEVRLSAPKNNEIAEIPCRSIFKLMFEMLRNRVFRKFVTGLFF